MSSFPLFFAIALTLYVLLNIGIIARVYFALRGISNWFRVPLCVLATVLSLSYVMVRAVEGNGPLVKAFTFVSTLWFAFIFHAVTMWVLIKIFRLLNIRFQWLRIAPENRMRWRHRCCAAVSVLALLVCAAGWINMKFPAIREEQLSLGATPLRIVALSDLHLGRLAGTDFLSGVVDRIESLQPDIVLFLGDILEYDYDSSEVEADAAVLRRLKPRLGIWGVMGNHEYIGGRGGLNRQNLEKIGITPLIDRWVALGEKPGEHILLVGRRDYAGYVRTPLQELLANAPTQGTLKILLDHQPRHLKDAEEAGFDLQLSGHTHGGQFFPVNLIIPFLFENAHGHSVRGQTHYWVTSGVGTWGPRIRTSGRPEIVLINIVPEK